MQQINLGKGRKSKNLLFKDLVGVQGHGAGAEAGCDGVLEGLNGLANPLIEGIEAQQTRLCHRLLHIRVFQCVPGIRKGQAQTYDKLTTLN